MLKNSEVATIKRFMKFSGKDRFSSHATQACCKILIMLFICGFRAACSALRLYGRKLAKVRAHALFAGLLTMGAPVFGATALCDKAPTMDQKKIVILSSNGGYGHNAAVATLKALLGQKYDIQVIYPIDQLRIWGVKSGEQVYNSMLQYGWIRSMNAIVKHIAPRIFRTRKKKLEKLIARQLEEKKPDLVISLIPFINLPACEAARKQNIPFLLITTDNDLRNWVHGLQGISHPHFRVTIGTDLPSTRDLLKKRNLADAVIETVGLPLRPDFRASKSLNELCQEYRVPVDKPVILIMMGGAGAASALDYTREIGGKEVGAHLIVCAGKNERLARKLKKIPLHPSNSITVMGFTDKVADLMTMADIIITKPGPGTINEALAMRLPMLIDTTTTPLSWERANVELVLRYGVGDRICDLEEIEPHVRNYLYNKDLRQNVQEAFAKVPPNLFHERIIGIVDSMCHY